MPNQPAVFGKRTGLPAGATPMQKPSRLMPIILAGVLTGLAFASVAFILRQPAGAADAGSANPLSEKVLALASDNPAEAHRLVRVGLESCLPGPALAFWTQEESKALATGIFVQTITLMSQNVTNAERDQRLQTFIVSQASKLPVDQHQDFRNLVSVGQLTDVEMAKCVSTAVAKSLL
jgi:hypothetical protein